MSLDYCSSCGICTQVCPQGVKIAEINSQARAALKADTGIPLRDRLIARPTLSGRLGTPVAPIANAVMRNRLARTLLEKSLGIHRAAPVPTWAGRTLQTWARKRGMRRPPQAAGAPGTVVYFHGCGANYYEPDTGERAVAVLEHNGLEVIVPQAGLLRAAAAEQRHLPRRPRRTCGALAAQLAPYARAGHDIVATSTSCGLMLKREAREILGVEDDDLARRGRARLRHLRVPRDAPRPRRAAHRLLAPSRWPCPTTPPASSAATASARRPST